MTLSILISHESSWTYVLNSYKSGFLGFFLAPLDVWEFAQKPPFNSYCVSLGKWFRPRKKFSSRVKDSSAKYTLGWCLQRNRRAFSETEHLGGTFQNFNLVWYPLFNRSFFTIMTAVTAQLKRVIEGFSNILLWNTMLPSMIALYTHT